MQFERFIARRFMPRKAEGGGFSGPLSAIAVAGIALGVAVMVMAISILRGFQTEITSKVAGFGSHITIASFTNAPDYQDAPILLDPSLLQQIASTQGVRHIQPSATKGGMIKTGQQIHGILLLGIAPQTDTAFFASSLTDGRMPRLTQNEKPSLEILISSSIAAKLQLAIGDKVRTYFWHDGGSRARAFSVCGIYNTDLAEMDHHYIIGDIRQIQRLNAWTSADNENNSPAPVGCYEVLVDDFNHLESTASRLLDILPYDITLHTVKEANPALFSWLGLLNSSVSLLLTLMCIVCAVTIVSALLIMIFEKSATIGILKTLGATNSSLRQIFLLKALRLIASGILAGDLLALTLALAQRHFGILRLDPQSYSMSLVPVELNTATFLLVSFGTLALCLLALLLPLAGIARITPAKTIRTE